MINEQELREAKECLESIIDGELLENSDNETLKPLVALAKAYLSAEMPKEKNFMSEVCMWRDDPNMIKEIRGECKGFNSALRLCKLASTKDKMRIKALEETLRKIVKNCHHHKTETIGGRGKQCY